MEKLTSCAAAASVRLPAGVQTHADMPWIPPEHCYLFRGKPIASATEALLHPSLETDLEQLLLDVREEETVL